MAIHLLTGDISNSWIKRKYYPLGYKFRIEDAQPFDKSYIERILKDIREQLNLGDTIALPVYKGKTCENYLEAVLNILGLCYEVYLYECDVTDSQDN